MFKKIFSHQKYQIIGVFALFVAISFFKLGGFDLQTNLIAPHKVKPFDGTTSPIAKAPHWALLTQNEWKLAYDQIPSNKLIDFPQYDAAQLKIPRSKLGSSAEDRLILSSQITFSVPYLGNYKLDGIEGAGSHPAVDIKVPQGTPVYAIANGEVVKASLQSSGFGHHIVIKHENVPSLEDPKILTTYYSTYNHMSDILVTEGQIVDKGQLIGKTGQTGTATTPHLHFQIDRDTAPWHPYWHFTSAEAAKVGYNFTTAIDAGFNKDKAEEATINPLLYVQKYAQGYKANTNSSSGGSSPVVSLPPSSSHTSSNSSSSQLPPSSSPTTKPATPASSSTSKGSTSDQLPPSSSKVNDDLPSSPQATEEVQKIAKFKIATSSSFSVNSSGKIQIMALDEKGKVIANFKPKNEVNLRIENGSAILSTTYLKASNFKNGLAEITLTPTADFGIRMSATYDNVKTLSDFIQPTTLAASNLTASLLTGMDLQNVDGELKQSASIFKDVNPSETYYEALTFLKKNGIIKGYDDGTFQPDKAVSRAEGLKFIYEGLKKPLKQTFVLRFKDVDKKAWYARYIATAYSDGLTKGYAGNLFKPNDALTKAEFLKMLFGLAKFDIASVKVSKNPYKDVKIGSWYASYVQYAQDKNIIDKNLDSFYPDQAITRAEAVEILYRTITLISQKKPIYTASLALGNNLF